MERTTAYWLDDFLFFRAVDDSKTAPKNFITLYNFFFEAISPRRGIYPVDCIGVFGGRTRARTWDPLIKSQLLYQLSYAPGLPSTGLAPLGAGHLAKRPRTVQPRVLQNPRPSASVFKERPPGKPGGILGGCRGIRESTGRTAANY